MLFELYVSRGKDSYYMSRFLNTLNYTASNEDSRSEIEALQITPEDQILCITGSGSRPLDLLTQSPQRIVAVDFNPCQNFLLELHVTAISELTYEGFIAFMGITPSPKRLQTYRLLQRYLSKEGQQFWERHSHLIERGVLYQGRW